MSARGSCYLPISLRGSANTITARSSAMSTTSFPSLSSEASTYETSESASSPISIQSTCSSVTSSAIDCRLQRVDIFRSDTRGASSAWHLVFRSRFPDGELDQRYRVIEEESRQVESILRSVGSTEVMGTNNSKVPEGMSHADQRYPYNLNKRRDQSRSHPS